MTLTSERAVRNDDPITVPTDGATANSVSDPIAFRTDDSVDNPTADPIGNPTAVQSDDLIAVQTDGATDASVSGLIDDPVGNSTDDPTAIQFDDPITFRTDGATATPVSDLIAVRSDNVVVVHSERARLVPASHNTSYSFVPMDVNTRSPEGRHPSVHHQIPVDSSPFSNVNYLMRSLFLIPSIHGVEPHSRGQGWEFWEIWSVPRGVVMWGGCASSDIEQEGC